MDINVPARPEAITPDTAWTAPVFVDMRNAFHEKGGTPDAIGMLDEAAAERIIRIDK